MIGYRIGVKLKPSFYARLKKVLFENLFQKSKILPCFLETFSNYVFFFQGSITQYTDHYLVIMRKPIFKSFRMMINHFGIGVLNYCSKCSALGSLIEIQFFR